MAYCNLSYSGHKGVINAAASVTELTTSGTTRRVRLRLSVWAVDYTGARDASYSVRCAQSGTEESVGMYQGFSIDGNAQDIFDESFSVTVPAGASTASIDFSFTASLLSPSAGTRTVSGTVTTLYLTEEPADSGGEAEPSPVRISLSSAEIGQQVVISIDRSSSACWHRLSYWVAGENMGIFASNVATAYLWKIPDISAKVTDSLTLTVTVKCSTYTGTANFIGQTEVSFLVTMPAATRPSCPESAVMGENLTVTLPRLAAGFTHELSWTVAGSTGIIASQAGESQIWEVPLSLAGLVPALTEVTCAVNCVTKVNGLTVGTETVTIRLTVPENEQTKPAFTMALSPVGDVPESYAGMFLQNKTGVKAVFTATSAYSKIKSHQLTMDGITVTGNPAVSAVISSCGKVTVVGKVTDARGFSREIRETLSVTAYEKPRVIPYPGETAVVAVRCNWDGTRNPTGTGLLIRAGRKYTALSDNAGEKNRCTLSYRYKAAGAESYGEFCMLLSADAQTDAAEAVVPDILAYSKTGYTLQLRALDSLGSYSVLTIPIGAAAVPLHIGRGNNRVAIGKYCDDSRENAFEIGLTTYFDTGIALRRIFEGGSWEVGTELGSAVADAEVSAAEKYTVFLGICGGKPKLLAKWGGGIYGEGVNMTLDGDSLTLEGAEAPVTALFAVV